MGKQGSVTSEDPSGQQYTQHTIGSDSGTRRKSYAERGMHSAGWALCLCSPLASALHSVASVLPFAFIVCIQSSVFVFCFCSFISSQHREWNPGPCTCSTYALPLSCTPALICSLLNVTSAINCKRIHNGLATSRCLRSSGSCPG